MQEIRRFCETHGGVYSQCTWCSNIIDVFVGRHLLHRFGVVSTLNKDTMVRSYHLAVNDIGTVTTGIGNMSVGDGGNHAA